MVCLSIVASVTMVMPGVSVSCGRRLFCLSVLSDSFD